MADQEPAPTIGLSSQDPNSASGFTDTATVNVSWSVTGWTCPSGQTCHLEYCLTQDAPQQSGGQLDCSQTNQNQWQHPLPTTFPLQGPGGTSPNGSTTLYAEYRVFYSSGGNNYFIPSASTSASIIVNLVGPSITLNSPVGLVLDANTGTTQTQLINETSPQWITYSDSTSSNPPESLTVTGYGCTTGALCGSYPSVTISPDSPYLHSLYVLGWQGSDRDTNDSFIYVTAQDQAGNQGSGYSQNGQAVFSLFDPSVSAASVTCAPSVCVDFADQPPNEMMDDSPSSFEYACQSPNPKIYFSGYADPSMRADPLPTSTNLWGTNLWMLYSYPKYQDIASPDCTHTGVVEVHLAESTTAGTTWDAWSSGTPIWPSETFLNGCSLPNNYSGTCYSSHEVANFWPYVNGNSETWYAVHLMYFLEPNTTANSYVQYGCLVTTVATSGSPTTLGWSKGNGPSSCGGTFPNTSSTTSATLPFTTLDAAVPANHQPQGTCVSWGEPAIMVAAAPAGNSGNAAYLAVSCFSNTFTSLGYYVFYSLDLSGLSSWTYYSGPFYYTDLPASSYTNQQGQEANSLTEFDWAARPDGSILAVVTPSYVPAGSGMGFQYGCAAVGFDLLNGFGGLIATVNDTDGSSGIWEELGSNGCTYDPMSNTGIVIVRHLINSGLTSPFNPLEYQLYSLIDTGVLP
ncbi:MAG TPA: hypothetical protein VMU04_07315 [Candidatus Acidoferrum sp.]|nr:hypothetical protein [Candidatus Acidoferrum sp.]